MKYRITVSPADGDVGDIPVEMLAGIECDGYQLLADCGNGVKAVAQNMNTFKAAGAIAYDKNLKVVAKIANLIIDLKEGHNHDID